MDWYAMSDNTIITEMGSRIQQIRLNQNISQSELSSKSGVHRVTISKFENGQQTSLLTFIQLLRGLEQLEKLDTLLPAPAISPLQLAKLEGKKRQRASRTDKPAEEASEW